jgi:hypothetical protein
VGRARRDALNASAELQLLRDGALPRFGELLLGFVELPVRLGAAREEVGLPPADGGDLLPGGGGVSASMPRRGGVRRGGLASTQLPGRRPRRHRKRAGAPEDFGQRARAVAAAATPSRSARRRQPGPML